MLKGSEKEMAQNIMKALKAEDAELLKSWEALCAVLIQHLIEKSLVMGVSPPNGGPIQGGKLA